MSWKFINLILIGIGSLLIFISATKYYNSLRIVDNIFEEIKVERNRLLKSVKSCKAIVAQRHKDHNIGQVNQEINDLEIGQVNSLLDEYSKTVNEVDLLIVDLIGFISHNDFYIDHYSIVKDSQSEEIYFGHKDNSHIKCNSYELLINSKIYDINYKGQYKIDFSNNINIEYRKYYYNFDKVDTIICFRTIEL